MFYTIMVLQLLPNNGMQFNLPYGRLIAFFIGLHKYLTLSHERFGWHYCEVGIAKCCIAHHKEGTWVEPNFTLGNILKTISLGTEVTKYYIARNRRGK